jgi:hypothetical protein
MTQRELPTGLVVDWSTCDRTRFGGGRYAPACCDRKFIGKFTGKRFDTQQLLAVRAA